MYKIGLQNKAIALNRFILLSSPDDESQVYYDFDIAFKKGQNVVGKPKIIRCIFVHNNF